MYADLSVYPSQTSSFLNQQNVDTKKKTKLNTPEDESSQVTSSLENRTLGNGN